MKKWTKAAIVATPLVFATSVYAYASERSAGQATIQIREVQPSPVEGQTVSEWYQIPNPFIVSRNQEQPQAESQSAAGTGDSAPQPSGQTPLTIDQIEKLNMKAGTDRGELKLEYHLEGNGTPRLNGEVGGVKVHMSGDKAKEMLNQLLTRWEMYGTLERILTDPAATVDAKAILSLEDFEIEIKEGKAIKLDDAKVQIRQAGGNRIDEKQAEKREETQVQEKGENEGKRKGQEKHDKKLEKHGKDHARDEGEDS